MGKTGHQLNSDGGECFGVKMTMDGGWGGCVRTWDWTSCGVVGEDLSGGALEPGAEPCAGATVW